MKIKKIKIEDINPAPYNPRIDLQPGDPEYEHLKKSINEFDLVEPLIMNINGNILIGGHQRLKILEERGDTHVDVSVVNLDPIKEKALNIALNKISGGWDHEKLNKIFEELSEIDDFDIEITGFTEEEIMPSFDNFTDNEKEVDEDIETENECPECGYKW